MNEVVLGIGNITYKAYDKDGIFYIRISSEFRLLEEGIIIACIVLHCIVLYCILLLGKIFFFFINLGRFWYIKINK